MAQTTADKTALERYLDRIKKIREFGINRASETGEEAERRKSRALIDYNYFSREYFPHLAYVDCAPYHIEEANAIAKDKNLKKIMEMFRASGKTTHFTVLVPLWLMARGEQLFWVIVGANETMAKMLISDLQAELEANENYKQDFKDGAKFGHWADGDFTTKKGNIFKALGRGQRPRGMKVRGKRPNGIVCSDVDDDKLSKNPTLLKEVVNWIIKALLPTMDGDGRFIYENNRIAVDTILSRLIAKRRKDGKPSFKHRQVNALLENGEPAWPQKHDRQYYLDQEDTMGTIEFQSEFMNNPIVVGEIFKPEMIQWGKAPHIDSFDMIVGWWDLAYSDSASADFNAVQIWGVKDNLYWCIKAYTRHATIKDVIKWIYFFNKNLPAGVSIRWVYEAQFWNVAIQQDIDAVAADYEFKYILEKSERPKGAKYDRIIKLLPYYQQGRFYYNANEQHSNDMVTGLAQLFGIEPGYSGHDDAPDAHEGAIKQLEVHNRLNKNLPVVGPARTQKGY